MHFYFIREYSFREVMSIIISKEPEMHFDSRSSPIKAQLHLKSLIRSSILSVWRSLPAECVCKLPNSYDSATKLNHSVERSVPLRDGIVPVRPSEFKCIAFGEICQGPFPEAVAMGQFDFMLELGIVVELFSPISIETAT